MAEISAEDAIARARAEAGLEAAEAARAWRVRRLDRPGDAYYLVVFGEDQATIAVAAVGVASGEVGTSARLPGRGPHLAVDSAQAIRLAGSGENAQAELVWRPCRASLSPLYPLWEIRTETRATYVDQQGRVWPELGPAGPGG